MFISEASPFLDRDITYGTAIVVLLLGVGFALYLTRKKDK